MKLCELTREAVTKHVFYDPTTGSFTRLIAAGGQPVGANIGSINADGYVLLSLCGLRLYAHRVAWFVEKGDWPEGDIDHEDTIRHHNWIKNLRPATRGQNMQNLRRAHRDNRTGLLGVTEGKNGRFIAQIKRTDGDTSHYAGSFGTPMEAHLAYLAEKAVHHPFQTLTQDSS